MGKEVLTFDDIEIEKINITVIKVLYIEKVSVSNKISFDEKNL